MTLWRGIRQIRKYDPLNDPGIQSGSIWVLIDFTTVTP